MSRHRAARLDYLLTNAWRSQASPWKRQRLLRSMTLDEVAEKAGVSRSVVIRAEAGHTVSDKSAFAISEALRVPREWLDADFASRLKVHLNEFEC